MVTKRLLPLIIGKQRANIYNFSNVKYTFIDVFLQKKHTHHKSYILRNRLQQPSLWHGFLK
jgi:hypothetical protein